MKAPNLKDKRRVLKIEVICPCGKEFLVSQKRLDAGKGKRCSKSCQYKFPNRPKGLKYEIKTNNPSWFKKGDNTVDKKNLNDIKFCPKCKEEKLCSEYYISSRGDGFRSYCKNCGKSYKSSPASNRMSAQRYNAEKKQQNYEFPKDYWEILVDIYGEQCLCCFSRENLQLDHVIPLSWGNSQTKLHNMSNFQILCKSCNTRKKDKHVDFRWIGYEAE